MLSRNIGGLVKRLFHVRPALYSTSMRDVIEGKDFNFPKEEKQILQLWKKIDAFG